jgi:hypothetical protein
LLQVSVFSSLRLLFLNGNPGVTLNDLKAELGRVDATVKKSGTPHAHETTPSQFIMRALEIEEQQ